MIQKPGGERPSRTTIMASIAAATLGSTLQPLLYIAVSLSLFLFVSLALVFSLSPLPSLAPSGDPLCYTAALRTDSDPSRVTHSRRRCYNERRNRAGSRNERELRERAYKTLDIQIARSLGVLEERRRRDWGAWRSRGSPVRFGVAQPVRRS